MTSLGSVSQNPSTLYFLSVTLMHCSIQLSKWSGILEVLNASNFKHGWGSVIIMLGSYTLHSKGRSMVVL